MSTTLVPNSFKKRRQNGNTFPVPASRGTAGAATRSAEPGTIAICFVAAALESVRARGLNADEMLANVGLSPSLLQVPQARVSAKHYGALWRTIALALDDEFFGQDSRRMKAGSFAMLCHSGVNPRVFAHELLLMLLYGVSCWLVGRRIPILRTEFSYPEPAHSDEYRLMYCTELGFDRPNTVIAFEASYLDLPVVQNERSIKEFLRTAPESILVKYKNGSSLAARVRRRLRQYLPGEVPDFEGLADELNLTPATRRRRLHEEGESYQSIKDQLRRDLAISYLSHSSRSVMDIALELGFSERSAFHRAFRKWTGASPGEFRRTSQA